MKKSLLLGIKIVVSCGLIWVIYRHVDIPVARAHMAAATPTAMASAIALCAAILWLNAWRWQLVLEVCGCPIRLSRLVSHTFVGFFFGQATPSTVGGDAVRAWLAYRDGATPSQAIRSVLIERMFGLAVLVVLAALGLPWLLAKAAPQFYSLVGEAAVFVACALAVACVWFLQGSTWLQRYRFGRGLHATAVDVWTILVRPKTTLLFTVLSLVSQIMICTTIWLIAMAIGAGLSWIDALIVMPGVFILSAVPISIAGWGVREGIMLFALGLFGVSAGNAVAISVLFGLVCFAVGLAGGVVWLLERNRPWLREDVRELSVGAFPTIAAPLPQPRDVRH